MEYRLNADEAACVKQLAERFERNQAVVTLSESTDRPGCYVDPLDLPAERREAILSLMEEMGVIVEVEHASEIRFFSYSIGPRALQLVRMIAEHETRKEEPRDIVENVKTTVRGHPILAWLIIGFLVLTTLVTFLNQLLQLLKTLGWM